jgi:DNA primase
LWPCPQDEDPDSFARKQGNRIKDYIKNNKQDFVSYKANLLLKEAGGDPIKKANVIKDIIGSLACVNDPIERSVLVKEVATIMQIDEMLVITELNKKSIKERKLETGSIRVVEQAKDILQDTAPRANNESLVEIQEKEIIRSLFNYGHQVIPDGRKLADIIIDELADIEFATPLYNSVMEIYKMAKLEDHVPDLAFFLSHQHEPYRKLATNLSVDPHDLSENWKEKHNIDISHERDDVLKLAIDNVLRLKFRVVQKMIQDNIVAMRSAKTDEEISRHIDMHTQMKDMEKLLAEELGIVIASV